MRHVGSVCVCVCVCVCVTDRERESSLRISNLRDVTAVTPSDGRKVESHFFLTIKTIKV